MRTIFLGINTGLASWTVDNDTTLVGVIPCSSAAARMVVSNNPSKSLADVETPSANGAVDELVLYLRTSSLTNAISTILTNLFIPLSKGSTIYAISSTTSSVILQLEDFAGF